MFESLTERSKLAIISILFALTAGAVTVVNISSLLPYLYCLFLTLVTAYLSGVKDYKRLASIFFVYSIGVIALYLAQYYTVPSYFGFSGDGLSGPHAGKGIGTDDSYFYSEIADSLPVEFPRRSPFYYESKHPYSNFIDFLSPYHVNHPFDVLFINVTIISFIPILVYKISLVFTKSKNVSRLSFVYSLLSPFMLSNSLILIRDGVAASLAAFVMYFTVSKKYLSIAVSISILAYIRLGGAVILSVFVTLFFIYKYTQSNWSKTKKLLVFILSVTFLGVSLFFIVPYIIDYLASKGVNTFGFREQFVSFYSDSRGGFGTLLNQPYYIRIPVTFIFYMILPIFGPSELVRSGIIVPRAFFINILSPIIFTVFLPGLVFSFIDSIRRKFNVITLLNIFIVISILSISQVSIQARHKTLVMPAIFISAAYGLTLNFRHKKYIYSIIVISYIACQVAFRMIFG